jgi:GNAT superfamily N-acetyltransferase
MKTNLQFRRGYYNDPALRAGLNTLVHEVFGGLDFTPWNDLGYAFEEYTPFSYFDGDRVVANVSASPMNLFVGGEQVAAMQIGTVATLEEFRGQGLIRSLTQRALEHWKVTHPLTFLFANETTSNFYQQFGFRRVIEHGFTAPAPSLGPPKVPARKLSLDHIPDRVLLRRLADWRSPVSHKLGVYDQTWLLLFHAAVAHPKHLTYIEPLDVAVISVARESTLRLIDVIGETIPPLREIYPYVGSHKINSIEFGFTPELMGVNNMVSTASDDSLFFVRGPFGIEGERFLFPLTGQA